MGVRWVGGWSVAAREKIVGRLPIIWGSISFPEAENALQVSNVDDPCEEGTVGPWQREIRARICLKPPT